MLLNIIKKGLAQQNININNKYSVVQIVKISYGYVDRVDWESVCAKSITLCMLWGKLKAIR